MECFSTAGLPARRKLSFWNEVSSETFTALEVVPGDPQHFEGRLYRQMLEQGPTPFGLVDVTTSPGCLQHTRAHVARALGERFTLLAGLSGGFSYWRAREGAVDVDSGDFCLLDHAEPYELRFDRVARTFCVVLPEALLADHLPDPGRLAGRVLHATDDAGGAHARLLLQLTRALSQELESGAARLLTPGVARSLVGFIAAALQQDAHDERGTERVARRRRVLRYVEQQLHDPQLRPAAIARHFGISERSLRLLFADCAEGLAAQLLRRRLEACAAQLREPAWRARTITEIALRHGFNNPTHFGHTFRRHFGVTPRDYRRAPAA